MITPDDRIKPETAPGAPKGRTHDMPAGKTSGVHAEDSACGRSAALLQGHGGTVVSGDAPASGAVPRKIRLDRPLLVEGRYDKNTLSQVATGVILSVGGFSVFHNDTLVAYLRRLAEPDGLLILTDSDGGGGQIRRAFNAKYPREYIDRPEKRRANLMDFARFYAEQGE